MIHPTATCKIFTLSEDRNELVYSTRARKYLQNSSNARNTVEILNH